MLESGEYQFRDLGGYTLSDMSTPPKANPAIYPAMRRNALEMKVPETPGGGVGLLLMDWIVANGTATVLASADGTASVYLSSGGGFIGGGQRYPQIGEAARRAVKLANEALPLAAKTTTYDLPKAGDVHFYLKTSEAVYLAVAREEKLRGGSDPLTKLGGMMQAIVTGYRLSQQTPPAQ